MNLAVRIAVMTAFRPKQQIPDPPQPEQEDSLKHGALEVFNTVAAVRPVFGSRVS